MNNFISHKVIIWILAGSLIVTLSILGSLIYHTWASPEKEVIAQQGCSSSCLMLFDELDLDANQQKEIETILDHYRDTSATLVFELRQCRLALMEELQKDEPDSIVIIKFSEELGYYQARITRLASTQYLQIRTICKPGQWQKLSNVYCDLFGCQRLEMGQGRGQQRHHHPEQ